MIGLHEPTNIFFYDFYNDRIVDKKILDGVSEKLYLFIMQQLNKYDKTRSKMSMDEYRYYLYKKINEDYKDEIINKNNQTNL